MKFVRWFVAVLVAVGLRCGGMRGERLFAEGRALGRLAMFFGRLFVRLLRLIGGLRVARPVRALFLFYGHPTSIVLGTLSGKLGLFLIDGNAPPPQSGKV